MRSIKAEEEIIGYGRQVPMMNPVGEKIERFKNTVALGLVEADEGEYDSWAVDYNNFLIGELDDEYTFVPPTVPDWNIIFVNAFNYQDRVWNLHDSAIRDYFSEPDEADLDKSETDTIIQNPLARFVPVAGDSVTVFESRLYPLDWEY